MGATPTLRLPEPDDAVPFQSPTTGKVQDVALEHWEEALRLGYKPTQHTVMYSPDGRRGMVPNAELADYQRAGYQNTPKTQFEKDRPGTGVNLEGAGETAWNTAKKLPAAIGSMVDPTTGVSGAALSWLGTNPRDWAAGRWRGAEGGWRAGASHLQETPLAAAIHESTETTADPSAAAWETPVAALGAPLGMSSEQARAHAARGEGGTILGEAAVPAAATLAAPLAVEAGLKLAGPIGRKLAPALHGVPTDAAKAEFFRQAIPPSKSAPYSAADYEAARPHLKAEHPGSGGVEAVRDAADRAIGKIEDTLEENIARGPQQPLEHSTLADVKQALGKSSRGQAFVDAGVKDLADFDLDQPKTLEELDAIRRQLNAENKATLLKNRYDVATARATDPAFAAREAAADSLRDTIYDTLDQAGLPGMKRLRLDEGSLIRLRNAAQNQIFNGEKVVSSTAKAGPLRQIARGATRMAATGAGAAVAGAPGAMVGSVLGDAAGRLLTPEGLTRNALADKSFAKSPAPRALAPALRRSGAPSRVVVLAPALTATAATRREPQLAPALAPPVRLAPPVQ
jgi:hypothetical protein